MNRKQLELYRQYDTVHYFWRDKVLTQLGISINLFLTIGIAILGYYLTQSNDDIIVLDKSKNIILYNIKKANDGSLSWCVKLMLILFFISVICGSIAITSRLHDLRITSKTAKLRKVALKKFKKELPDKFDNVKKEYHIKYYEATMIALVGYKNYDISSKKKLEESFLKLRTITEQLGEFTWFLHIIQIGTFILGIFLFIINYFIN